MVERRTVQIETNIEAVNRLSPSTSQPTTAETDLTEASAHLAPFADGQWAFWRWVGIRGAGFSVMPMLDLAEPASVAAANTIQRCEEVVEQRQTEALDALERLLTDLPEERTSIIGAIRQVRAGKRPKPLPFSEATNHLLNQWAEATMELAAAQANLRSAMETSTVETTRTLQGIARSNHFREALIWQNREALHTGVEQFIAAPAETTRSIFRQHRELVAKYLQRYCVKNDTIGFFGPLGWARCVADEATEENQAIIAITPGAGLLATRAVSFETWGMTALGEALGKDPAVLQWAVPRLLPYLYFDGAMLHLPFSKPIPLPNAQAAVLRVCDGQRTAHEIAMLLMHDPSGGVSTAAEVYAALEKLQAARRIIWAYEVSADGLHPEQSLRQQFERIGDDTLRANALTKLQRLEAAREAVAEAAGAAERLDAALLHLETTFSEITDTPPVRAAGKMFAARTLAYEDCRRDVSMTLGPKLLQALQEPLALLLTSARWFTYEVARRYQQVFKEAYAELAKRNGSATVDFASFWPWVHPLLFEGTTRPLDAIIPQLYERWSRVLELPTKAAHDERHITYRMSDIAARVQELFAAPAPGWTAARYHSPDILIDATDVAAIQRDDYRLVLGEVHIGRNTLDCNALAPQHPVPDELLAMTARDIPAPRIIPVMARATLPAKRNHVTLIHPKDYRLIFAPDSCGVPPSQALPTGQLVIEESAAGLVVRTRDHRLTFDLMEVFGEFLTTQIVNCFGVLRPSQHTPRLSFDRLVVCRESWRFAPADCAFAFAKDAPERFLAARRWLREQGLPRFLFARTPLERKPFYMDFDSPMYLEILVKAIRRTQESEASDGMITLSEMLPDPYHAWFPDAEGNRYTSELRFVARDLAGR